MKIMIILLNLAATAFILTGGSSLLYSISEYVALHFNDIEIDDEELLLKIFRGIVPMMTGVTLLQTQRIFF